MSVRDAYIALLEKRATETPDYAVDSHQVALQEYKANVGDRREYLRSLFDQAGSVEEEQSRQVGKLFPGNSPHESGHPLLKFAHEVFASALAETDLLKTASPAYLEAVFYGFARELEKIAALSQAELDWIMAGGHDPEVQQFFRSHGITPAPRPAITARVRKVAPIPVSAPHPAPLPSLKGVQWLGPGIPKAQNFAKPLAQAVGAAPKPVSRASKAMGALSRVFK